MKEGPAERRSRCPIACSLDIVGDRWTLLVLRDLLEGKTRFHEFEASAEGITTNILTERLRRLEAHGLLERVVPSGARRAEYRATDAGRDLRGALLSLADWGNANLDDTWSPPEDYLSSG